MRLEEHRRMFELEDTYWWFVGRRSVLRTLVSRLIDGSTQMSIIDVGCGTGANLVLLRDYGRPMGIDSSEGAIRFCLQRGIHDLAVGSAERLPLAAESADIVTILEVLEHLDDDAAAMAELTRVLRPGGRAVITVPAHQFLWSEHDEALDHRRRYSRRQLTDLVKRAGLKTERVAFCVTFLFGPILTFRWLQRLKQRLFGRPERAKTALILMPAPISTFFVWLLRLEGWLLRWVNIPLGVTLLCVARKPDEDADG